MKRDCLHCLHGDFTTAQFNETQRQAHMMNCRIEKWWYVRADLGCQNGKFQATSAEITAKRMDFINKYAPELAQNIDKQGKQ